MQELKLSWNRSALTDGGLLSLLDVAESAEMLANLETEHAVVRQLVRLHLKGGRTPQELEHVEGMHMERVLEHDQERQVAHIIVRNEHPLSVVAITSPDIAILPPFRLDQRGLEINVRGSPEGIRAFMQATERIMPPSKVAVQQSDVDLSPVLERILTGKQATYLSAAIARGYYAYPRGMSLSELAAELEVSRTTLTQHLRRAEAKVMAWVLEQGAQGR